jgi:uncharacterized membrane protein YphA (DoxX/SURF4 family)
MTNVGTAAPNQPEWRPMIWSRWISTICRFVLAAVWLWAGLAKAADPWMAERAVDAYQLVPAMLVKPVAWGLPFIEIGLAMLLALGIATRTIATISMALLGAFMIGIGSAWARGIQIACGCFGGGGADPSATWISYFWEIARDAAVAGMAARLVVRPQSFFMFRRR